MSTEGFFYRIVFMINALRHKCFYCRHARGARKDSHVQNVSLCRSFLEFSSYVSFHKLLLINRLVEICGQNLIGHVVRGERLLKVVLEEKIEGKKTRGRLMMGKIDDLMK